VLSAQMMNEEVDDLVGLGSSMTRMDGTLEAGVEGLSAPPGGSGEDPAAASAPAQVEEMH
jgi:hypothetical protein